MTSLCDLHLHTTASDGSETPTQLVAHAREVELRVIAIADHDSTEGVAEALAAARGSGLEVIPGLEVSTDVPAGEVHLLGYFVNTASEELQSILRLLRESRVGRARKMVEKLATLGMSLDYERVREIAGAGSVGRPHVAQAMLEKGYVATSVEAFNRYIGRNGPAYVERYKLTPVEAVGLVRRAGGLPGLAHPVIMGAAESLGGDYNLDSLLAELVGAGLVAMECFYTGYPREVTDSLLARARALNLVATGGSDYHGANLCGPVLGGVDVPLSSVADLKARLGKRITNHR